MTTIIQSLGIQTNGIIPDNSTPAPSASAQSEAEPVMPAVAELQFSGDPGAMLAALTMTTAKNERETATQQRDNAMSAQEKAEAAQIQDMRDKADLQRIQGVVDGAMQIGQGLCDLGAGLNQVHAAAEQGEESVEKAELADNGKAYAQDHVDALKSSIDTLNQGAQASQTNTAWDKFGSSAFGAARSISDGIFNGAITDKDADAKTHEAAADTFKRFADDANDSVKDAKDLMAKAIEFYKDYCDAKNQTAMAAIHRA